MTLRRYCDQCEDYIPSGNAYLQVMLFDRDGRVLKAQDWDEACALSANGYLEREIYALKHQLVREIRVRWETV